MGDRSILGPADVSDAALTAMVAADRGLEPGRVTLLSSTVEEVAYDLPAITTAGRYWVRGTATADDEPWPFELFVKHVQSWSRSPLFASVPEDLREWAATTVPCSRSAATASWASRRRTASLSYTRRYAHPPIRHDGFPCRGLRILLRGRRPDLWRALEASAVRRARGAGDHLRAGRVAGAHMGSGRPTCGERGAHYRRLGPVIQRLRHFRRDDRARLARPPAAGTRIGAATRSPSNLPNATPASRRVDPRRRQARGIPEVRLSPSRDFPEAFDSQSRETRTASPVTLRVTLICPWARLNRLNGCGSPTT